MGLCKRGRVRTLIEKERERGREIVFGGNIFLSKRKLVALDGYTGYEKYAYRRRE